MPKTKKPKKPKKHIPVKRHWTQDNERKNVIKAIIKGRKAGLTWNEICQDIYNRGNIYISPPALQQRLTYYLIKESQSKKETKKCLRMPKKKLLKIVAPDTTTIGTKLESGKIPFEEVAIHKDKFRLLSLHDSSAVPDGEVIKPKTDQFALAKMIESMIEGKVSAVLVDVKTKVNELDEQFTKAFAGVIKLEKVIKALRNEVNSYGK